MPLVQSCGLSLSKALTNCKKTFIFSALCFQDAQLLEESDLNVCMSRDSACHLVLQIASGYSGSNELLLTG